MGAMGFSNDRAASAAVPYGEGYVLDEHEVSWIGGGVV
jgi:hypothetical protein